MTGRQNVRSDSHAREARYTEALINVQWHRITADAVARAVMAVADAEREQDAATIAELRARLRAVEALVDEMEAKPRPALMKGYSALTVVSLDRLRAALAPSTSPAEQEGDRG